MIIDHQAWMQKAIALAEEARNQGEVPVGAIVVYQNEMIGEGFNQPILSSDPTAHAEIVAIRRACAHLQNYRLVNATLYVTIEPCAMCAGAIVHARIQQVVFGAFEPKAGAIESRDRFFEKTFLNHRVAFASGIMAEESSLLLKDFFERRRMHAKQVRK